MLALLLPILLLETWLPYEQTTNAGDSFEQRIAVLTLDGETIFAAIGKLSQTADIVFSIEGRLPPKNGGPLPPHPRFSGRIEGRSLKEVLDWLCGLDPEYTWTRDHNTANLFPRAVLNDSSYLLNRKLAILRFDGEPDAGKAVLAVVGQLPGAREQLAFLQGGGSTTFAKPPKATFRNVTVREALNRIAEQLGPTWGWQFSGTNEFKFVVFHERISYEWKPDGNP